MNTLLGFCHNKNHETKVDRSKFFRYAHNIKQYELDKPLIRAFFMAD